jgi:Na+/melibiose symporter-like transporter
MTQAGAPSGANVGEAVIAPPGLGPRPKVGVPTKLLYGFGSVAFGVKDNGFRVFLVFYYNQVVGLPVMWVTVALAIALAVDSFVDPVVGQMSDYWKSKWGRRHPFLYASAIPAALSFLLLWNPPFHLSHGWQLAWLVGTAIIVRTFITCFEIPSSAMTAELTEDYDERTKIIGYRVLMAWWGGLTLNVFALLVLMRPTEGFKDGRLNPDSYGPYGWIAAGLIFASIMLSAIGTHRFIPWMPKGPTTRPPGLIQLFKQMAGTLKNKAFLTVAGAALFAAAAEGVGFSIYIYLVTYFWKLTAMQMGILITDAYFGSLVAFFFAPFISKGRNKKGAAMITLVLTVMLSALPILLRLGGLFPPEGSPWVIPALYGIAIIRGALGITCSILIVAMIADVVEDSQVQTGRRSEGLFFAAVSFISKSVSGVGAIITGLILTLIHFPVGRPASEVPQATVNALGLAYIPTLFVLYGAALFCLSFYRITRESHAANLAKIAAMARAEEEAMPPPL